MPRKYTHQNLSGQKFGRLTVQNEAGRNAKKRQYLWNCICECGKFHVVRADMLKNLMVRSCGCLQSEAGARMGAIFGPLNARPRVILTNRKFGRLTAVEWTHTNSGKSAWKCKCDCGSEVVVKSDSLTMGLTRSCGCYNSDVKSDETAKRNTTHGMTNAPSYSNWKSMMSRCCNPNTRYFYKYGGRGIVPCEFIRASPANLIVSVGEKPTPKHEVDRIKNSLGYYCGSCPECIAKGFPKNIRWATRKEQMRNRGVSAMFKINDVVKCAAAWAEEMGIKPTQFMYRFRDSRIPNLCNQPS